MEKQLAMLSVRKYYLSMVIRRRKNQMKLFHIISFVVFLMANADNAFSAGKAVFWKDGEIWTVNQDKSELKQLTKDRTIKISPVWSPDGTKIAYCIGLDHKIPLGKIVIIDNSGKVIKDFNIPSSDENDVVREVTRINWIDANRIGVTGQVNMSVSIYSIVEISSIQLVNILYGQQFVWSPDNKKILVGGWYPYLTPEPFYQSDYVEISENPYQRMQKKFIEIVEGENAIYPTPNERKQEIIEKKYHRFQSELSWSPDGEQVAVVDEFGDEVTRNLYLIIVNGQTKTVKKVPFQGSVIGVKKIYWSTDKRFLYLSAKDKGWEVDSITGVIMAITNDQLKAKVPAYADELSKKQIIEELKGSEANWYFGN